MSYLSSLGSDRVLPFNVRASGLAYPFSSSSSRPRLGPLPRSRRLFVADLPISFAVPTPSLYSYGLSTRRYIYVRRILTLRPSLGVLGESLIPWAYPS